MSETGTQATPDDRARALLPHDFHRDKSPGLGSKHSPSGKGRYAVAGVRRHLDICHSRNQRTIIFAPQPLWDDSTPREVGAAWASSQVSMVDEHEEIQFLRRVRLSETATGVRLLD